MLARCAGLDKSASACHIQRWRGHHPDQALAMVAVPLRSALPASSSDAIAFAADALLPSLGLAKLRLNKFLLLGGRQLPERQDALYLDFCIQLHEPQTVQRHLSRTEQRFIGWTGIALWW